MNFQSDKLKLSQDMDFEDELKDFRKRFDIRESDTIYMDGNSLGRLALESSEKLNQVIKYEWANRLIRSWNEQWMDYPQKLGSKIAELIGAQPDEVIVSDSTSVNLFKLVVAALKLKEDRTNIISDQTNFPSDLYIMQGVIDLLGNKHKLLLADYSNPVEVDEPQLIDLVDEHTALVSLSHVSFKSAFLYNMTSVTKAVQKKGGLMLWDLSHSVGAVPINLNENHVDMAIGCTYKYLNGGPGSPAFLYVRKDLQQALNSPIQGWFGADRPFEFNTSYTPGEGINRFLAGTTPILSSAALDASLDIIHEAGMDRIRKKNIRQTEYLLFLIRQWLLPLGFSIASPENASNRGSHISIRHPEGYRICQALIDSEPPEKKVIPDFRTPDNIRLGIASLYTTFEEIWHAVNAIKHITEHRIYKQYVSERSGVT